MTKKKRIVYLVPHVNIAGGIAVILQHVVRLRRRGYDAYVINLSGTDDVPGDMSWFPYVEEVALYPMMHEERPEYTEIDVLIAGSWDSINTLETMEAQKKVYFVQSDDRRFTENENVREGIHRTYSTECIYMTEARWIQKWLKKEFGHNSYYVPNGLDGEIVKEIDGLRSLKRKRVLLEGAINVPFKGMLDAYNAAKECDADVWIVSNDGHPPEGWDYEKFYEKVPMRAMAEIYSSCDVLVKMSRVEGFFGPPMEAMACGCAVVVGQVTGYDEYIADRRNALVVEMGDTVAATQAIKHILANDGVRERLVAAGYRTAHRWQWDRAIDKLEKVWSKKFYHVVTNKWVRLDKK